jgi:hypothetical protein
LSLLVTPGRLCWAPRPQCDWPISSFDDLDQFHAGAHLRPGGATRAEIDAAFLTLRLCWQTCSIRMIAKQKGNDMKTALSIATIAFFFVACPIAATLDMPLERPAASFALGEAAGQNTASPWDGRWQGTTVSGQQLVLELRVKGQRVTGRLMVGRQSADITAGKVVDEVFALTTGPIDGHSVAGTGRRLGDAIELTIDGVKEPLTLTRIR